jgi:putative copper resistance protein D
MGDTRNVTEELAMTFRALLAHSYRFIAYALFVMLPVSNPPQGSAHEHSTDSQHIGHEGMSMAMDEQTQMDATYQRKLLADKKESEFNHHLAGFFVILAGLFILAEGRLRQRWSFLRFAWPACFLLSGLFLIVFSDTELWPFGPQSWWYGLTHNLEDLQHKTFALILLALGIIEVQRARGISVATWTGWLFPILACCGSVLLLFHEHNGGMHGAAHMTTMARIQAEHLSFAATGFGIAVFKGLSEVPTRWQVIFARLWSLLMIVLGVLLMLYSE